MRARRFGAFLLAAGFAQGVAAGTPREPHLLNIQEVFTADDYPISAQRNNVEGTTKVDVLVGADGLAKSCIVTQSSGSAVLDEQSCALLRARARFSAARDAHGHYVDGHYTKPVTWRLDGDDDQQYLPRQASLMRITTSVNAQGHMVGCSMQAIGIEQGPDACAAFAKSDEYAALSDADRIVAADAVLEMQFVPVEYGKAVIPPLRTDAKFVGRQIVRIEADATGEITLCEVTETTGAASSETSFCNQSPRPRFAPDPAKREFKGTLITTAYARDRHLS